MDSIDELDPDGSATDNNQSNKRFGHSSGKRTTVMIIVSEPNR